MILLAILGILVNGVAVLRLRGEKSQNVKVVSLHLMEDVLGWVAVLIGSIVIYFTEWYYIDPLLSIGIAIYILHNVVKNLKKSFKIILQARPENVSYEEVGSQLLAVEHVQDYHDLHIWTLDGEKNILTVHLVVGTDDSEEHTAIKREVKERMASLDVIHCTLELEEEGEPCADLANDD